MTDAAHNYKQLMALFDELCDLSPTSKSRRLSALKLESPALVSDLEKMLAADADQASFLDDERGVAQFLPGLADQVLAARWRLIAHIGAGSGGEVWQAEDLRDGGFVALKLIHPRLMHDPKHEVRFRREFVALSKLSHDGCLRLLAEGVVEEALPLVELGRRFLVTEFVGGGDLSRLTFAPLSELLPILIQLLTALEHVHERGFVHRDLKPANVLLTEDEPPRPKLADFGIVKTWMREGTELTGDGALLGTIDYLSPEQVRGEALDARSDLYAFGCLIHTLVTGRPPFHGTLMARLWRRAQRDAPALALRAPQTPTSLCDLTDALLARDKEVRPSSAHAVAERLTAILAELSPEAQRQGSDYSTEAPRLFPTGLVGRDALVSKLLERCAHVRDELEPATLSFVGPAGVGKTTMCHGLLGQLERAGWQTIVAPAIPSGGGPPFWPFPRLAQDIAKRADKDATQSGSTEDVDAGSSHTTSARPGDGAERAARAIASQWCDAARALSPGPLCILVEDLHEASAAALLVLRHWQPLATGMPWLVLATARPQSEESLRQLPGGEVHRVAPLDEEATAQLAERLLGAGQGELPTKLVSDLLPETGGNPLLLRGAVQRLLDGGDLLRTNGAWTLGVDAELRPAMAEVLDSRLQAISAPTQKILLAAAAMGRDFDAAMLAPATSSSEKDVAQALAEAVRVAVIAPWDNRSEEHTRSYRFEHATLNERLVESAPGDALIALHDSLGEEWKRRGAPLSTLAHHFGQGSDASTAVLHLRAAAKEAHKAQDHQTRARHLAAACRRLQSMPDSPARTDELDELRESYSDALAVTGAHGAALAELRAVERPERSRTVRARLLRKRGLVYLRTPTPTRALEALSGSLVLLGDATPRTRVGRLARLGWDAACAFIGRFFPGSHEGGQLEERAIVHRELSMLYRWIDMYDGAAHLTRFYRLAHRLRAPHFRVDANAFGSLMFALQSAPGTGGYLQRRARELAEATGDLDGLARLTIIQGACEAMLEDSVTSVVRLDEAVALAAQTGDPTLLSFALSSRGWLRGLVGVVSDARHDFQHAEEVATEHGAVWLAADAKCGRMLTAVVMGRFDEARALATEVLTSDLRYGFPIFEEVAIESLAGVAFLEGRFADAARGYERAQSMLTKHRLGEGWGWLLPMSHMESLCCLADSEGKSAVPHLPRRLRGVLRSFRSMDRLPLYKGCTEVARGVVKARQGKTKAALRLFERGAARRLPGRRSHVDTWVSVRPALERLHLGEDPEVIAAILDGVNADYEARGLAGMQGWLHDMRSSLNV
ncbi:MAG: serine/threonine-protein kinase PknK [Polyangiales bacterium]